MRYPERDVGNVSDLLRLLQEDAERLRTDFGKPDGDSPEILHLPVLFRGLVDKKWGLTTTMLRSGAIDQEVALMNRFKQNAPQLVDRHPDTDWEWMYLMRHHGLPSRLLDWTESALIGAYFAVTPSLHGGADQQAAIERADKRDGALWCLLPTELNAKSSLYSQGPFDIPMLEDPASNSQMYLPDNVSNKQLTTKIGPGAAIGDEGIIPHARSARRLCHLASRRDSHREDRRRLSRLEIQRSSEEQEAATKRASSPRDNATCSLP